MSLWRSILNGFGSRVGSDLAKGALDELQNDEEKRALAVASRNRKIAIAVVAISALGLLALSGALTAIFKWLLGAVFIVGLVGGAWFLARKRWYAYKASREVAKEQTRQEDAEKARLRSVQQQLDELKQKRGEKT